MILKRFFSKIWDQCCGIVDSHCLWHQLPHWREFKSQLFHFKSRSLPMYLGKQWKMPKCLYSGSRPGRSSGLLPFNWPSSGACRKWMEDLSLPHHHLSLPHLSTFLPLSYSSPCNFAFQITKCLKLNQWIRYSKVTTVTLHIQRFPLLYSTSPVDVWNHVPSPPCIISFPIYNTPTIMFNVFFILKKHLPHCGQNFVSLRCDYKNNMNFLFLPHKFTNRRFILIDHLSYLV